MALSLLLALALPLFWHLSPQYDASGTLIAPLQPALALALAASARVGWRALPAVMIGAAIAACGWPLAAPGAESVTEAAALVLQAAFGGLLMRRSSRPDDVALDTDPAIRRLVAAALACAAIGALTEVAVDLLWAGQAQRLGIVALVRGTADGASVLMLTPVALAFASPERLRWVARRRTVALPLALLALVMLAAFAGIDARDRQQAQQRFERDADVVFGRTQALLDAPMQTVLALNGALRSAAMTPGGGFFDALARPWLARTAGVKQVGWIDVPRGEPGASPTAAGASVRHQLSAGASAGGAPAAESEALPAALPLRSSVARALSQEGAVVSPVVTLGGDERAGFIVYQALPTEGPAGQRSVVFATVLADRLMTPLLALRTDALRACLTDQDARSGQRRLYGPAGCEAAGTRDAAGFSREVGFDFGGRHWSLNISQPVRTPGGVWLFALPALTGCGLLAVLLLKVTGRVQRVEADARQRVDEVQREITQLRHLQQRGELALDGAFEAAQTGLALLEGDGRVQRANPAFAELIGSAPEALKRRPIDELLVDDEQPQQGHIARLLHEAGDELAHRTLRLRLPGGRVLPALVTLRVLREPDGRAAAAVCALHDLSDKLRRSQAERLLGDVLDLAGANPPTLPPQRAPRSTQAQRVLCIQRDAAHAAQLRAALAERPQLQLTHADDAEHGFAQVLAEAPHLVLLDAELAGGDGLALLQRLWDDQRTRAIPVIVLAEDPRPARIDAAFSAGARAYLTRPVDQRKLLQAIDELS